MVCRTWKQRVGVVAAGCAAGVVVVAGASGAAATGPESPSRVAEEVVVSTEVTGLVSGAVGVLGSPTSPAPAAGRSSVVLAGFVYGSVGELAPGLGVATAG